MSNLDQLRKQIDETDKKLVNLLAARFEIAHQIRQIKLKQHKAVRDKKREAELLKRLVGLGQSLKVDPRFIKKLYAQILKESRRIQKQTK